MSKFGTLSVLEDLASWTSESVISNEDFVARRITEALAVHNALFEDMASDYATFTSLPMLPYGGADAAIVQELDEWGAADASKPGEFGNLGLPLRLYGSTIQWTRTAFENMSVAELAAQADAHALADIRNFYAILRRVIFTNTNTSGYLDRLQSKLTYDLKALLNADGAAIPNSPNGTSFDGSTHTHYSGSASLTQAAIITLIENVVEHGVGGSVQVHIAKGDESTVRGFADFSPYVDSRLTYVGSAVVGTGTLDMSNPDNRAIGVLGGAEVWVKPWVPSNYQVAIDVGASEKPLAIRTRTGSLTGSGAFRIVSEHEHYPLRARNMGREYGVGVVGRHKAAVLRSNNGTYAIPSGI